MINVNINNYLFDIVYDILNKTITNRNENVYIARFLFEKAIIIY